MFLDILKFLFIPFALGLVIIAAILVLYTSIVYLAAHHPNLLGAAFLFVFVWLLGAAFYSIKDYI